MTEDEVPEIEADDADAAVAAGALLLDVREPDEWVEGHAPAAVHVPMREVQDRLAELPKDRLVVAICRSGARSRAVAALLLTEGYDVVNTVGGMQAWQAFGLDVVTDNGAPGVVA
jgi:rhodanese-related sulfurtransferase